MICKKCKSPMETRGAFMWGMHIDWWECPNRCNPNKSKKQKEKTLKNQSKKSIQDELMIQKTTKTLHNSA